MSIKDIIARNKMKMTKFAEKYCIPYRTIQNWTTESDSKRECHSYVENLLSMCETEEKQFVKEQYGSYNVKDCKNYYKINDIVLHKTEEDLELLEYYDSKDKDLLEFVIDFKKQIAFNRALLMHKAMMFQYAEIYYEPVHEDDEDTAYIVKVKGLKYSEWSEIATALIEIYANNKRNKMMYKRPHKVYNATNFVDLIEMIDSENEVQSYEI